MMTTIVDDTSSLLEAALALVSSGEVGGVPVETVDDEAMLTMRAMSALARAVEYILGMILADVLLDTL